MVLLECGYPTFGYGWFDCIGVFIDFQPFFEKSQVTPSLYNMMV
jgi:hypothetical protein